MRIARVSSPAECGAPAVARRAAAAAAAARAGQHGVRAIRCDAVAGPPGKCVAHVVAPPRAAQRVAFPRRSLFFSSSTSQQHQSTSQARSSISSHATPISSAVLRHSGAELAEAGVLPLLTECLPDAMLAVRETAACALGHVAKHSGDMAMRVAGRGCGADSPLSGNVTPHSLLRLHATALADAGGITAVISLLGSPDVKTRRQLPSTVHVIKNKNTGAAILEAATKLEATHMVLASSAGKGASQWHTINACSDETKLPPGATLFIIEDGKKLKSIS
ncbi:unnamed protein product [Closterium sp. Yama58-4]|nr:unnamed protein product [Closterium sp. Yama58-4]